LLCLFVFYLFGVDSISAATPTPTPTANTSHTPSVDAGVDGPNPAPPIGIPCGKTVCLEGEVCTKFPGDVDEHCVPDPIPTNAAGEKFNPVLPPQCPAGTGVFPPNSVCWNEIINTQTSIREYDHTCIYEPVAEYSDDRWLNRGPQPFNQCGIGDSGPGGPPAPGGDTYECAVNMLVYTDVRDAELGGYAPSTLAEASYSADFLAQNYLYNSLFGRPMNLSSSYDKKNAALNNGYPTREAYRTYWRLLPAANQANLRSFVMNSAHDDQMDNFSFNYIDSNGMKKSTSFKKLFDALSKQVILFWHFPFIRIGCLTQYPVCPEYAQAIRELKPVFQDIRNLVRDLNLGPLATIPIDIYEGAISAFGGDLDGPYAAFVPLDFNSMRGYILKKKDTKEESYYETYYDELVDEYNSGRYGRNKPLLTNISYEHLPYLSAIYQGLLSPKFGMIPALQPQAIIDKWATESGISDYRAGNTPLTMPEVRIAQKNFLQRIVDEAVAIISDPLGWIATNILGIGTPEDYKKVGYTENGTDNPRDRIRSVYDNPRGCPLPTSYHLLAPKTVPISLDDHHQVITIEGKRVQWAYDPICQPLEQQKCDKNGQNCTTEYIDCPVSPETYIEGGMCCTRHWQVSGREHGKALDVLNNPKQTDIREVVAANNSYSFYKTMLPAGASKITDAAIDAYEAFHFVSYSDRGGTVEAIGPNDGGSSSKVLNPAEPVNRIDNFSQDTIHMLQNCWTVPETLQNSPRCKIEFPPEATSSSSLCGGEAFKKIDPNPAAPSAKATDFFVSTIEPTLSDEVISAYAEAEKQTGVPCEVLAGIHFEEGDNDPKKDLQSGAPLNGRSLTESAVQAAEELKGKAGGDITSMDQLAMALSYYNGGGNANCQASSSYNCPSATSDQCGMTAACSTNTSACTCTGTAEAGSCRAACTAGFPYQFSYPYCPPSNIGYDDPYVVNWWQSPQHDEMYLLYMYDCTQTRPQIHTRPGSLTVAINLFLSETK